jgi:pimeloyl-ACP methyl ester carboxylesterase
LLESRDGTQLRWHSVGAGPFIVLANGLGGSFLAWRHLAAHLAPDFQVISFDYRGTHGSAKPQDPGAITIADHLADLEAVLEQFNVARALFVGWSMGVQLAFELYRHRPEVIVGIAGIDGSAGRTFEAVRRKPLKRIATALTLATLKHGGGLVGLAARAAVRTPRVVDFLKAVQLVNPQVDEQIFYEMAAAFAQVDFTMYGAALAKLDLHNAWDVLPSVRAPVTIMTGERDFMTPVDVAQRMVRLLPDAELVVLEGCTHYATAEAPAGINRAIDELIGRCRW